MNEKCWFLKKLEKNYWNFIHSPAGQSYTAQFAVIPLSLISAEMTLNCCRFLTFKKVTQRKWEKHEAHVKFTLIPKNPTKTNASKCNLSSSRRCPGTFRKIKQNSEYSTKGLSTKAKYCIWNLYLYCLSSVIWVKENKFKNHRKTKLDIWLCNLIALCLMYILHGCWSTWIPWFWSVKTLLYICCEFLKTTIFIYIVEHEVS